MSGERLLLDSTFIAGLINSRDQLHLQAKDFLPLVETWCGRPGFTVGY